MLGFKSNANEMVEVEDGELDEFWMKKAKDVNRQRKNISNVILQIFHSWVSKRILGRMRESKVTDQELNWMFAALVKKQEIDPTYIMVEKAPLNSKVESIRLSSLHCLRTSKRSSMGSGVSALCGQRF